MRINADAEFQRERFIECGDLTRMEARAPAAVFLAKHRESPEIDNPKAGDCLSL